MSLFYQCRFLEEEVKNVLPQTSRAPSAYGGGFVRHTGTFIGFLVKNVIFLAGRGAATDNKATKISCDHDTMTFSTSFGDFQCNL
jgi:hypothetical protein